MQERWNEDDFELQSEKSEGSTRASKRKRRNQPKRFSWPFKLGISFVLILISLVAGLCVGYAGLGHGPLHEVFDFQTYKHMYDLVFKMT